MLNRDKHWRWDRSGTAGLQQSCCANETGEPSRPSLLQEGIRNLGQAAFAESWRPHSQVQAGFPRSPSGGNIW
jgi:hypothetical protein